MNKVVKLYSSTNVGFLVEKTEKKSNLYYYIVVNNFSVVTN